MDTGERAQDDTFPSRTGLTSRHTRSEYRSIMTVNAEIRCSVWFAGVSAVPTAMRAPGRIRPPPTRVTGADHALRDNINAADSVQSDRSTGAHSSAG
jgi:hypothetical protein